MSQVINPGPKFPNFLILGVAKAGTTALYHTLKQHPQIFMSPVKEPGFFSFDEKQPSYCGPGDSIVKRIVRLEEYVDLFSSQTEEVAIGEASPSYLTNRGAGERIRRHIPAARLIAILRDPSERAFSNYMQLVRMEREPFDDFRLALQDEPRRLCEGWSPFWGYRSNGYYFEAVKRFFDLFPRDQIRIFLFEDDWQNRREWMVREILNLLEVDTSFPLDLRHRYNVSGTPRSKWLNRIAHTSPMKRLVKPLIPPTWRRATMQALDVRNLQPVTLPTDIRESLIRDYKDDILRLQDLIGRDLSRWMEVNRSHEQSNRATP